MSASSAALSRQPIHERLRARQSSELAPAPYRTQPQMHVYPPAHICAIAPKKWSLCAAVRDMKLEKAFGEAVRIKRRAAGLSQEGFAEVMGMQATAISRLEQGAVSPSLDMVARIAAAFQTMPSGAAGAGRADPTVRGRHCRTTDTAQEIKRTGMRERLDSAARCRMGRCHRRRGEQARPSLPTLRVPPLGTKAAARQDNQPSPPTPPHPEVLDPIRARPLSQRCPKGESPCPTVGH